MLTGTIICPVCKTALADGHRFCTGCGTPVQRSCRSCGAALAASASFCGVCGADHRAAGDTRFGNGRLSPRVPGERKRLTVVIADIVESTRLLAGVDTEQGRRLFEAVLDEMKASVEAFNGNVIQVSGDGMVVLFGAPRALEEHALRACSAALHMQAVIGSTGFRSRVGLPVSIRVGLHSGEVVVAERGSGLDYQYTVYGLTAHLAARLEQAARPGQVLVSGTTWALVAGRAKGRSLGDIVAKGIDEPVEAIVLTGITDNTVMAPASGKAVPFIGRDAPLGSLRRLIGAARGGRGQSVVVVGEPGSGKSRLCREALNGSAAGFRVIEVRGSSFPPTPPYSAVVHCIHACLPAGTGIAAWLGELAAEAPGQAEALRPLLARDGGSASQQSGQQPGPHRQRQAEIIAAVSHVLCRAAQAEPVVVLIDDLQWVDEASAQVLSMLGRNATAAPLLVMATARSGSSFAGFGGDDCTVIQLQPFTEDETSRFVLSSAPRALAPQTARHLFQLTGGNAFFLEEVLRTMHHDGLRQAAIPNSVHDLVAMRIDHLTPRTKFVLQAAAVLGMDVEARHLGQMIGWEQSALHRALAELNDASLMVPVEGAAWRFTFRHVLGRDAAYHGLLQENRQHFHARALHVLQAAGNEEPSSLAFHAIRCLDWHSAHQHSRSAAEISLNRAAPDDALRYCLDALHALGQLPPEPAVMRAELNLRFLIRNTLFSLARADEIGEHLAAARELAVLLGDREAHARAVCQSSHHAWQMGRWSDAISIGEDARILAAGIGDIGLQVSSTFFMGLASFALGEFDAGADLLAQNVRVLTGGLAHERFGFVSVCSVVSGSYLAICLTELGRFTEAEGAASTAREVAIAAGSPFDRVQAELALAQVSLAQGRAEGSVVLLEDALALCRKASMAVLLPRASAALAFAYALTGRVEEAAGLAGERDEKSGEAVRAMSLASTAEALLLCGEADAAAARASALITFAAGSTQPGAELWGRLLLAYSHFAREEWDQALTLADACRTEACKRRMRPLAARAGLLRAVSAVRRHGGMSGDAVAAAVTECEDAGLGAWPAHLERLADRAACH